MSRLLVLQTFPGSIFLDPSVLGTYPQELVEILHEHGLLPDTTEGELELIRDNTVDFLGVNYYQPFACYGASICLSIQRVPLFTRTFLRALCDAWT